MPKQTYTEGVFSLEENNIEPEFEAPFRVVISYRSRPSTGSRSRQQYYATIFDGKDNCVTCVNSWARSLDAFADTARRARYICAALNFAD